MTSSRGARGDLSRAAPGQTAFPAEEMVTDKEGVGVWVMECINNCTPLLDRGLLTGKMEQNR